MSQDIHGKTYHATFVLLITLTATFAGSLMQTTMATAMPALMKAFQISFSTAQQATTWFLLVNGAVVPLSAYLATKFPTKWLSLGLYSLLLAGLLISYATPSVPNDWWLFLVGRVLAAAAFGILLPLMQTIIATIFPPKQMAVAMGLSGLVVGLAPALGPILSGWILSRNHWFFGLFISQSWRNIFLVPIILVACMLILAIFQMKDVLPNRTVPRDFTSLGLSLVGFSSLLLGLTNVATVGWWNVPAVLTPGIVGLLLICVFIRRQLRLDIPFLNVRVFLNKAFTLPTVLVVLVMMAMYGVEMMLPTYLQNILGLTPFQSGLTLLGGALFMGGLSPVSGFLFNRVGVRRLALFGFSLLTLGTLPFAFISPTTSAKLIAIIYALRLIGIALVMMPLTISAMNAFPQSMAAHASTANNMARQLGASVAVALLSSVTQNIISQHMPTGQLKVTNPLAYAGQTLAASMAGFRISFCIGVAFAVVGLGVAWLLKPKGDR